MPTSELWIWAAAGPKCSRSTDLTRIPVPPYIRTRLRHEPTAMTTLPRGEQASASLTLLIDGQCSVCTREVRLLKRLDRGRGILAFEDISGPRFDGAAWGVTRDQAMSEMHAFASDGDKLTGMEVFRRAYALVGWGWLWAPTGWPVLRPIFDALYRLFSRNRVKWFGGARCEGGACAVRRQHPSSDAPTITN